MFELILTLTAGAVTIATFGYALYAVIKCWRLSR